MNGFLSETFPKDIKGAEELPARQFFSAFFVCMQFYRL